MQKFSEIVNRAEEVRKRVGLNKSQFAGRFGMKPQTYNNFVGSQESKPNMELFNGVVSQFGVNPAWLLNGVGEPFISSPYNIPASGPAQTTAAPEKIPERFRHDPASLRALGRELDTVLFAYRTGATPLLVSTRPSSAEVSHAAQVLTHLFWADPVDAAAQVLALLDSFSHLSEEMEWLSQRASE